MSFITFLSVHTLMKAETNFYLIVFYGISDIIYMRSLFESRKRDLEKFAQFIKLIMKKFVFNRRTADTDSVSISKKKNVITTRSGRQVNPPKKLCL